jgi:outer membrane protein assembly factor BamD (BamD/ComL family)
MHTFNQKIFVYLAILLAGCIFSCKPADKKLAERIDVIEKELYNDTLFVPDNAKAQEAIKLYVEYAENFPADTFSPLYLFKAADISSKISETSKAINLYKLLEEKYPNHRNAPYALFLQGFIYENQVGNPAKAKPLYEKFLQKYPDHPIAADVSRSIENLGKSPEELIKEFESRLDSSKMQMPDSTTARK